MTAQLFGNIWKGTLATFLSSSYAPDALQWARSIDQIHEGILLWYVEKKNEKDQNGYSSTWISLSMFTPEKWQEKVEQCCAD